MSQPSVNTLRAHKAISLAQDLNGTERRVIAALVDHFNRKTGQCDPSLRTIAALLSISERSVIRAIGSLVDKGYLARKVHGGRFHRNSYRPDWQRFEACEAAWTGARLQRARQNAQTLLSPSGGQACHLAPAKPDTQTCSSNLIKETLFADPPPAAGGDVLRAKISKRPGKQEQGPKPWASSNGLGLGSRQQAADQRAIARWDADLRNHFGPNHAAYGEAVNAIGPELIARATAQERARPGTGAALLLRELQTRSLTVSTGTCDG